MLSTATKTILDQLLKNKSIIEESIAVLLSRFPTKLYENRFIVGHIVECIIADNSGCTVTKNTKRTDITDGQNNYSVKYSSSGNIKLYNTLGECKDVDICPTFLIFPDRITYIDKDILNKVHGDYNV